MKAYGINAVQALIHHHPDSVIKISVLSSENSRVNALIQAAKAQQIAIEPCDKRAFDKLLDKPYRHQGVVAEYADVNPSGENKLLADIKNLENPFVLILDAIKDPHNFGACLRTAAAVGVDAVVFPKDKAVSLTPTVHHVAAGASFALNLYQVTNLARVMRGLQAAGIWLHGADIDAAQDLYQHDLSGPMALVMGAEGEGMRHLTKQHCDVLIKIPMQEGIESLNVSVATGVCLFEIYRQRQSPA